jgi:glycosyltransferase involved in cell wall biosynthesis
MKGERPVLDGKRIVVVLPAYNAERTLVKTYEELPHEYLDGVVLVDDGSHDRTVHMAQNLGIHTVLHPENRGYGGNQKSCYREALALGADVVVMVHPDYQYSPRLVLAMASMVGSGHYDVVLGSRILGGHARGGGMPLYKYVANRILTLVQNLALGAKLSEYHTGLRAFSRKVLETLPLGENSDNFVFDNEMLAQALYFDMNIGEISCPTRYMEEASSIRLAPSIRYGLGVLRVTAQYVLARIGWWRTPILDPQGRRLGSGT